MNWEQYISDFDQKTQQDLIELCNKYYKEANSVIKGRNRLVFVFDTYVIKLPVCSLGFEDNEWEGSISNTEDSFNDHSYEQYPNTELWIEKCITVLKMELIQHTNYKEIIDRLSFLPDWDFSNHCHYVGFNLGGRLVAYDYGKY